LATVQIYSLVISETDVIILVSNFCLSASQIREEVLYSWASHCTNKYLSSKKKIEYFT